MFNKPDEKEYYTRFSVPFPKVCCQVVASFGLCQGDANANQNYFVQLIDDKITNEGFSFFVQCAEENASFNNDTNIHYIAIGY